MPIEEKEGKGVSLVKADLCPREKGGGEGKGRP